MKTRNRMMLIIVPVMLACMILLNIAYGLFFQNFIISEEDRQIRAVESNLSSFIKDNQKGYVGRINDWSHWDDTYAFLAGEFPEYAEINITKETFYNLDVDLIMFTDITGSVVGAFYYDFQQDMFAETPAGITGEQNALVNLSKASGDVFSILRMGDKFYFITASDVTDSAKTMTPNGKMILGKEVDRETMEKLEKNLGCRIDSIKTVENGTDSETTEVVADPSLTPEMTGLQRNGGSINLVFQVADGYEVTPSIQVNFTKARDIYLSGMKNVIWFAAGNTILFLLVIVLVFFLLTRYLAKPYNRLYTDIMSVDLNQDEFIKLPEEGSHDFLNLRKTVNKMLERINLEQGRVKGEEEKLQATLLSVGDGVITVDIDKNIQFMNPAAEKVTGWANHDAAGVNIYQVLNVQDESMIRELEHSAAVISEREEVFHLSYQTLMTTRNDVEKYIDISVAPIRDKQSQVLGYVFVFRDFSEKREKQEKIRYLSYHDQLTDVYNRRFFEEELVRLDKPENLPISFIYADLDGLKFVNDAFGHQSGDQMILEVANTLKETCGEGMIARLGGDEFVVVMKKTDSSQASILADQIKAKVEKIRINSIEISVSLGWDTKYREHESAIITIKNAEDSMYQKKLLSVNSKSNAVIKTILNTLMLKNPREKYHSQRVALFCKMMGEAMQFHEDKVKELETAGDLHDIGKIILDETIVNKSGALTAEEWVEVRKHPETGYRLLGNTAEFYKIAEYVRDHHERWDGGGYPQGLKEEEIHWEARIIAIADAYDAMTAERTYRRTLTEAEAVEEITANAGKQFDPVLARVFVEKVLGHTWRGY